MRTSLRLGALVLLAGTSVGVACSGASKGSGFNNQGSPDSSAGDDAQTDDGGTTTDDGPGNLVGDAEAGNGCPPCSVGNFNVPKNKCDDDCDGLSDNPDVCDTKVPVSGPAGDIAKAMGLCQTATGANDPKWGVISATYTQGYMGAGMPIDGQHGVLPKFGSVIVPREGKSLAVLSSGYGREYDDLTQTSCGPNGIGVPCFKGGVDLQMNGTGITNGAPPGYPKPGNGCVVDNTVHDAIGVTLKIKVPGNAQGFSFDFNFWSGEWPEWVCTNYNDSFVAWLTSKAFKGKAGDFNISYDSMNNPVSVNNGFFDRCSPMNAMVGCNGTPKTDPCTGGSMELQGTGFYNMGTYCLSQSTGGGATGWLETKAPVKGGEVMTIQFIIWDTGDGVYDSSVLLDNFQWYGTPTMPGTTRPPQ